MKAIRTKNIEFICLSNEDAKEAYGSWPDPKCIISDGAYGVGGFPGDPYSADDLVEWYTPHVAAWSSRSNLDTTLWFWNTELGWATVHPLLIQNGWEFKNLHIWDKGIGQIAGNTNSKTLRQFPIVTEVCAQYIRKPRVLDMAGRLVHIRDWMRAEWKRTGLPMYLTNEACGVKNAATRKYLTLDRHWYIPPVDAFLKMVEYANLKGKTEGRPYFSLNGSYSVSEKEYELWRPTFNFKNGYTNVWNYPSVRGEERLKIGSKSIHLNQKPIELLTLIIEASTDEYDIVWDPFAGLGSVGVTAQKLCRICYASEINSEYFKHASKRLVNQQVMMSYE